MFTPFLGFSVIALALLSASRLLLAWLYHGRVTDATEWSELLLMGLRADIIQVGYFVVLPLLLLLAVIPWLRSERIQTLWFRLTLSWFALCLLILWFMEISTPAFIAQYDTRPNRLFFEYLMYPAEVFSTLWNGFRGWLIVGTASTALAAWLLYRATVTSASRFKPRTIKRRYLFIAWPVLVILVTLGIRSTLAHRPANPAFFAVTSDPMVNSLILNSTYTVEYALYNLKHESEANRVYGDLSDQEILHQVRDVSYLADESFDSQQYPTSHRQEPSVAHEKPLNIVIILEESLGATFVKSLGGQALTPNLEALKDKGWWFEQLYATGIRSVRGIEAVVAGFLPTRARSTVKLSKSQRKFFTMAQALADNGYFTEFIYGGESHFDNMANFFIGNGFQSIVDFDDYPAPNFVGSWGVSDEDLFAKLHQRLKDNDGQQPRFTLAFSSSNHEPFEFPDGAIELAETPKNTVNNAVKYADYALGQFFKQAKQSDYWDNTLFLVVADHDTRVYGDELIPVSKFHIPGLILGADIEHKRLTAVASQIDLAPTLLSLAGVSVRTPMVGQDLSDPNEPPANRAMMQFGDNYGWLQGDELTVLTVDGGIQRFHYAADQKVLSPLLEPLGEAELNQIKAFAMLPSLLYQKRLYQP